MTLHPGSPKAIVLSFGIIGTNHETSRRTLTKIKILTDLDILIY